MLSLDGEVSGRRVFPRSPKARDRGHPAEAMGCKVVYGIVPEGGKTLERLAEERYWKGVLGERGTREQGSEGTVDSEQGTREQGSKGTVDSEQGTREQGSKGTVDSEQ